MSTHRDNRAGIVQLVAEHQGCPVGLEAGVELLGDVVRAVLGGEELLVGQVGVRVGVLAHDGGAHIGRGVLCKKTGCYDNEVHSNAYQLASPSSALIEGMVGVAWATDGDTR